MKQAQNFLRFSAIYAAFCVAIGAFGAHGLASVLKANQRVETFDTGIKYMFYHALGGLIIGLLATQENNLKLKTPFWSLMAGSLIFGLSLIFLSVFNLKFFGAIAPIGGTLMVVGWIVLAFRVKNLE